MAIADVRAKTEDELNSELAILKKAQYNLRFQKAGGQLEKAHEVRKARRAIARVKTVLTERAKGIEISAKASAKASAKSEKSAKTSKPAKKQAAKKTNESEAKE